MSDLKVSTDEIVGHIYQTFDYGKFKIGSKNRRLNEDSIKRLTRSIVDGDSGYDAPIVVLPDFTIFDGQHRFHARRRLELPIFYTFTNEGGGIDAKERLANARTRFPLSDSVDLRCAEGNEEALNIRSDSESFGVTYSQILIAAGLTAIGISPRIRIAKYSGERRDRTVRLLGMLRIFKDYPFSRSTKFIEAFAEVAGMARFVSTTLERAIEKHGGILKPQRNVKDYILNIIEMYNYGLPESNRLIPYDSIKCRA